MFNCNLDIVFFIIMILIIIGMIAINVNMYNKIKKFSNNWLNFIIK